MAQRGRPRRADIERPTCPWPGHKRRDVRHHGVLKDADGTITRRRYLCSPGTTKEHTFSLPVGPDERLLPPEPTAGTGTSVRKLDTRRPYVPPEPCPEHPGSTVTRCGVYRSGRGTRQRYQCTPVGWTAGATRSENPDIAKHVFTPVLPRAHVSGDAACPHCAELRAINRGDTAIARWHTATTGHVATALERLGKGESYADVGEWLQSELRAKGPSAQKKDGYRRAADIVEVFAPVVWQDWISGLGDEQATAATSKHRMPRVVMVDDLPIFDKAQKRRRQQQRFAILGLAEVTFAPSSGKVRETRLRLLRAYPSHSTDAYTLLLADLPYVPDFVIADGGKGIEPAVKLLAERTGQEVTFITSAYHLREQLRRVIAKARASKSSFNPGDLAQRVEQFGPTQSRAAWVQWWADYERRLRAQGVPRSGWPVRAKSESYQRTIDQLDALAAWPDVPRSTGHLEDLFSRYVKASIKPRGRGFGNLVRTNQLLDLFVLRANGYFDDRPRVIEALRRDAVEGDPDNAGFAPPVRTITDPGLERSLLDESVVARLVTQRGLSAPPAPKRKRAAKKASSPLRGRSGGTGAA
jgi:hypothetical protein